MYQFKNWKLICEEKDREIARLKEELERVKRMERLTKRQILKTSDNKEFVGCNIEIGQMNSCSDCNDSCMHGRCKWQEKANQKLKEYEDLEEQGKLIKLQCKVGDVVYSDEKCITFKGLQPFQITNIMISQNKKGEWTKKYRAMHLLNGKTVDWQINFEFDELGKTVFRKMCGKTDLMVGKCELTQEELKALAETGDKQ